MILHGLKRIHSFIHNGYHMVSVFGQRIRNVIRNEWLVLHY
jgi:hypothetical protein